MLIFVATRHVFTPQNNTIDAVASGFAEAAPATVIVEGFPTAMGENPAPLVAEAKRYETAEADDYAKGEAMYAASEGLRRGIPFLGGEPTRGEEVQGLEKRGYLRPDISFAFVLRALSYSVHSGAIGERREPDLHREFDRWSAATAHDYSLDLLSFEEFSARYRRAFGVDLVDDESLGDRSDPGPDSAVGVLLQSDMVVRDEHLLATVLGRLSLKKRVLVVYGGSHWTTLSQALKKRLGAPAIRVFAEHR